MEGLLYSFPVNSIGDKIKLLKSETSCSERWCEEHEELEEFVTDDGCHPSEDLTIRIQRHNRDQTIEHINIIYLAPSFAISSSG